MKLHPIGQLVGRLRTLCFITMEMRKVVEREKRFIYLLFFSIEDECNDDDDAACLEGFQRTMNSGSSGWCRL